MPKPLIHKRSLLLLKMSDPHVQSIKHIVQALNQCPCLNLDGVHMSEPYIHVIEACLELI